MGILPITDTAQLSTTDGQPFLAQSFGAGSLLFASVFQGHILEEPVEPFADVQLP